jgi:DeoR family glycerol-3-phosphate regulon repressor
MDMAQALQVSDETIRRDLKVLEAEGHLRRVHGGAVPTALIHDHPIDQRSRKHAKEKSVIARLARDQISDETVIFLDTGTTTLSLARQLTGFTNLKLFTNSVKIALAAREHHGVTLHLTPGRLRRVEQDLVGYDTVSYIQQFYFDIAFMGTAAVDLDRGFMDYEEDEARIRQTLIECARLRVFLADSSKFGKTANIQTAPFSLIDQIVTDSRPNRDFVDRISQSKAELINA